MTKERKKYTYYFKEGGWNTEFATSEKQAIKQANERWKESPYLTPNEATFFIANKKQTQSLLNLFY